MKAKASFVLLVCALGPSLADEPMAPPAAYTTCSRTGRFCAELVPGKDAVVYEVLRNGQKKPLWSLPGWHRALFLSNDGTHAVTCFDGLNLIPANYDRNMVLLDVWNKADRVYQIRLNELLPPRALKRTISHYHWGQCVGFDQSGTFVVGTADGKTVHVEPWSGKVTRQ